MRVLQRLDEGRFVVRLTHRHTEAGTDGPPIGPPHRDTPRFVSSLLLFDLDEAERGIIEDDDAHGQPFASRGQELGRAHEQPAVTGHCDYWAISLQQAAPIAAGTANPMVASPLEMSTPSGSSAGHNDITGNMWAPASTVTRAAG